MKFLKTYIFLLLIAITGTSVNAQVCDLLIPICTSQDGLDNNAVDPSPITIQTTCQNLASQRTLWYQILIDQPTNFTFQIEPTGNVDYDFAVYVNADCASLGIADRGSFDAPGAGEYDTGLNLTATDQCETAAGDGQVMFLALVPGDEVIIVVDRFSTTPDTYDLTFGDPDAFDCSIVQTDACVGDTVTLDAENPLAINYVWEYDDGSGTFVEIYNGNFPTIDVTLSGTYRARIQFNGGGEDVSIFNVIFHVPPVIAAPPEDLFECDDGVNPGVFDLTQNDAVILGGQNPADYNITYHTNLFDANSGANPIATPGAYMIVTPPVEMIFSRIEDLTGTCYEVDSFDIVFISVTAGPMTEAVACDDNGSGTASIDLVALKNAEALGTQDPADYTVSYHRSLAEANGDINPHPNPYTVTGPFESVFVRVESNLDPTCFATEVFLVRVWDTPPVTTPTAYELCDVVPNDGFAEFNLPTKDAEITSSNPDAVVTYHISQANAESGSFPLANLYTNTTPGFQTVWARVENVNASECYSVVPLDLIVNDSPEITDPISDYFICDNDGDSVEIFDLTTKDAEILNILVNVTLSYHTSQADALAGINAIATPAVYPSGGEIIWVRAENPAGCVTVGSFFLVLGQVPAHVVVPEFEQCDNDGDGFEDFDLNTQNATMSMGT